jgi:hypothetical protein
MDPQHSPSDNPLETPGAQQMAAWTLSSRAPARPLEPRRQPIPPEPSAASGDRLGPGQLDGLVLDYMHKHATDEPLGSTTVAKGLGRSSSAVGNCLKRCLRPARSGRPAITLGVTRSSRCLDMHATVQAFVKNQGLGFAIPYLDNGEPHDYIPDFIVRLDNGVHLILETKGYDPRAEVKEQAAHRWVDAVNADGSFGEWRYAIVRNPNAVGSAIDGALE